MGSEGIPEYDVQIAPAAQRQIRKLPRPVQRRVLRRLEDLATDPLPRGSKKLDEDVYRVRVGDYRIVYSVQHEILVVLVVKVGNRRDVCRRGHTG